ncbi:MAG: heme A synthase [Candidatus Binatia bacterium]
MNHTGRRKNPDLWLHRVALLTACLTFPLLFIGGLVTSKGAGLAVPDWPTTFGYNMFLYPWSKMVGGILYEHSHRLIASAVGLLTMILAFVFWRYGGRKWLCWLGLLALVLVIIQGILGGLRVLWVREGLAVLHACIAQAFFALTVSLVFFTSQEWSEDRPKFHSNGAEYTRRLCILTTTMIFFQGVFGAVLRHRGTMLDAHLFFAVLVTLQVILLGSKILSAYSDQPRLVRSALHLNGLLILQLGLGLGSYLGKFAPFGIALPSSVVVALTTTHLATGALMLVTSLILTLRFYRLSIIPKPLMGQGFLSEEASI